MSESLLNWDDYIQVASLSDVGMRRATNQDNLSVSLASSMEQWQRKGHVFIVADGMGAHAAGELASKLAIDHIPHLYAKYNDSSAPEEMRKAVEGANSEIHRRGQANEEFHNMGTTCSVLTILPEGAVCAHIGDSRVYRLTQNRIEQLTFDHSLVWEMKFAGQLSEEEERLGKIPKNVITRSLGPYAECKVDLEGPFPIQVGDTFLLCSDGLTAVISDTEIGSILANMSPDEAVKVLVDLSNLRGGPDNITAVIVKIGHPKLATSGNGSSGKSTRGSSSDKPLVPATFWGGIYWFGYRINTPVFLRFLADRPIHWSGFSSSNRLPSFAANKKFLSRQTQQRRTGFRKRPLCPLGMRFEWTICQTIS
ncbi:protein phosphatase 2C domain-containing protein [bacterium]|nr:protein phosphatase 2C domain-containing protein [bacterium]